MRIDLNYRVAESYSAEKQASSARKGGAPSNLGTDSANLSLDPKAESLSNAVMGISDVRESRVAALAKSIADGTYKVTPEQTAEALFGQMVAGLK